MKIVTFAHRLEIGGTQVNAIDLCAGLRDLHGCEVVLFATPGPATHLAQAKGLRLVAAPDVHIHPAPARMRALRQLVRAERPDVVHAWDWWQCLDAYCSTYLPWRVPLLTTDMMLSLARVLPKAVPTTFGTPEMVDTARRAGRREAQLLLPPVDVRANSASAVDATPFRAAHGLDDGLLDIVTVTRLATWMKSESLVRTIEAVRALGRSMPLRFVIVGEGEARAALQRLADEVNAELGRRAVVLTGALLDPRPAYAAADIVVGMGTSALRGMAFAKPVIVLGKAGFSATFDQHSADRFLYTGMYGVGRGAADDGLLTGQLRALLADRDALPTLGRFGREFVERHFALEVVCAQLFELLRRARAAGVPRTRSLVDAMRTTAVYLRERRFLCPSRDKAPIDAINDTSALGEAGPGVVPVVGDANR